MPDPTPANTGPALDQDALLSRINDNTASLLARSFAERDAADAERRQAEADERRRASASIDRRDGQIANVDPIAAAVMPVVAPLTNRAIVEARLARDAAGFWASDEGKRAAPYMRDLNRASEEMVGAGAPLAMGDIWNWYQGKNRASMAERATAEKTAQEKAARDAAAAAAGQGRVGGETEIPAALKDPYTATHEDLTKALAGVSF